jgi:hypothetical protein
VDRRGIEAIERELEAEYRTSAALAGSAAPSGGASPSARRAALRSLDSPVAVAFALGCLVGASAGAVLTALLLLARAH